MADGVSPERLSAKEVREIVYTWDVHKKRIKDWRCLPKWTYNPTLKKPSSKASVEAPENFLLGDAQGDILNDGENFDLTEYQAIEDKGREEDAESLFEHQDDQDSSDGYVWPSDEYLVEVLSYSDSWATKFLNQDKSATSTSHSLTIILGASRQAIMSQHRVLTFRVLVHRMTDMH